MPRINMPLSIQPGHSQTRNQQTAPVTKDIPPFDWKGRYGYWCEVYKGQFKQPALGSHVRLHMNSGSVMEGAVEKLTETEVRLKTRNASLVLQRNLIAGESRALLFAEDFVNYMASRKASAEKREHENP